MVGDGKLPRNLCSLLESPDIIKAGRLIDGDINRLRESCHSSRPFSGVSDLAKLAKERCVLQDIAGTSLSDLAARVLHLRINKNVANRISNAWTDPVLTNAQKHYAGIDAYASLRIYEVLSTLPAPCPLISVVGPIHAETPVLLHALDRTSYIASGVIFGELPARSDSRQNDTVMVRIDSVLRCAAIVDPEANPPKPLQEYGAAPFLLAYPRNRLAVYHPLPSPPLPPPTFHHDEHNPLPPLSAPLNEETEDYEIPQGTTNQYETDPDSAAHGEQACQPPTRWSTKTRSRVIKDAFHAMRLIEISQRHPLYQEFCCALRDAMFIPDPDDVKRITAHGAAQTPPVPFNDYWQYQPEWTFKRCKRVIPPREIVHPRVRKVLKLYGPLRDPQTQLPLFNQRAWTSAQNLLKIIDDGLISDPPGVPLYHQVGIDKQTGLPLYRCVRGTNMTEGGVHAHLRSHLPSSGASLEHIIAALLDFVLHHNLVVSFCQSCHAHL
jgi:3''-5'' exonuclease.